VTAWIVRAVCLGLAFALAACNGPGPRRRHARRQRPVQETLPTQPDTTAQVSDSLHYLPPVVDERVRQVPAQLARAVKQNPEANLPRLVSFLIQDRLTDSAKVRVIHDWMADNIVYDVQGYLSGHLPGGSPADVLRTGKSVCQGFGNLFEQMCKLAGLECVTVSGYGRGYSFRLFETEDLTKSNHAWDAVRIDGRWRLVDVTWDAGYVEGGRYIKEYSLDHFLAEPSAFVFTHFPEDQAWQLMRPALGVQQFTNLPFLRGGFWTYGLKFTTAFSRVNRAEDEVEFAVLAPPNVSVLAGLLREDETKIPGATTVRRKGGVYCLTVKFPGPGRWIVRLYAKAGPPSGMHHAVADLGFLPSILP